MAPDRPDLRWASKVRASAAFCLVGIMAGTGLYFSNLAYVRAQNEAAAERQAAPGPSSGEASATPATAGPGWQQGTDSLYATQEVGAAVDKSGRIWVAGGLTGPDRATTKTEFYDPRIGVWGPGPDLPVALHHAMMVSYQKTVWVIGGLELQGSEVSGTASARVLRLNQAEGLWVDAPALHHARGAGAAAKS